MQHGSPEQPIIRPPSEWRSTLIRVTRGCNWNRCRFCGIYPHLGQADFSVRSFAEIADDIALHAARHPETEEIFLGDADPLSGGDDLLIRVLDLLHQNFAPRKITCYARASTLNKLGAEAIGTLARHGLTRVHLGLESGDDEILRFQRKGQSAAMFVAVSQMLRQAGIEQSFYLLLGLGGADKWRQHITGTAEVINATQPEFARVRRLWLYEAGPRRDQPGCPLLSQVQDGSFLPQTPEGTVRELALLLERLEPSDTYFTCDHANNIVQVNGFLNTDLAAMRREVDSFLNLPEHQRQAVYAAHQSGI